MTGATSAIISLPLRALAASPTTQEPVPTESSVIDEVLVNVKRQRLGAGTVEDLALPDDFLRRFADRVIRSSYEENFRIVVKDPDPKEATPNANEPHETEAKVEPTQLTDPSVKTDPPDASSTRTSSIGSSWLIRGAAVLFAALIGVWLVRRQRRTAS